MSLDREAARPVLVVDDEPSICRLLDLYLTGAGYVVRTALTAEQAQRLVRESRPDVVLLDVLMPTANGADLLAQWHAEGLVPGLPVIVLTSAIRFLHVLADLHQHGARATLGKPFALQEVLDTIQDVLAQPSTSTG